MSKKKKSAKKRPVKRRTKNPRRTGRAVAKKSTSARSKPKAPKRSKKTAAQLIKSARSLLEMELGRAEGRQIFATRKPEKKKHAKTAAKIRAQIRNLSK